MSETTNANVNTNDAETTKSTLDINVEQHLKFEDITSVKYVSSVEFCETVNKAFGSIYSDWEGCKLVFIPNTQQLMFQFFFNHRNSDVPGLYKAVSKDGVDTPTVNRTLAAIRQRDNLLVNGDRYHLTEDGKSGLKKFFFDGNTVFDKDGVPKWSKITADMTDNNASMFAQQLPQQLTCVNFIDPTKIATLLFGAEVDGDQWVYNISVKRSMPVVGFGSNTSNLLLSIERISVEQTKKLAAMYGLVFSNGLGIVR